MLFHFDLNFILTYNIYILSDLNVFRMKSLTVDLIDITIYAWETSKQPKACAKLFTKSPNMANLVNPQYNFCD